MKNGEEHDLVHDEKRRNIVAGLGVGAALGVVFWSALSDLLPAPLDLAVGIVTGFAIGYSIGKRPLMTMRYPSFVIRRLLLAGAAFVLGVFAYNYVLGLELTDSARLLSSLLAIVPAIAFIVTLGSAIANLDEMQRRIQTEAIAIAYGGTAIVVVVFALLSFAGVPNPNWGWLLVIMPLMWLLGKLWTMWRYR